MNQFKVSTRLIWLVITLSLMLIAGAALGIIGLQMDKKALETVYKDRTMSLIYLSEVEFVLLRNRIAVSKILLDPSPDSMSSNLKELEENQQRASKAWSLYAATAATLEEEKLSRDYEAFYKKYLLEGLGPLLKMFKEPNFDLELAKKHQLSVVTPMTQPMYKSLERLLKIQEEVSKTEFESGVERNGMITWTAISGLLAGLVFSSLTAWFIIRNISQAMQQAIHVTNEFAAGNLKTPITVDGRNEFTQLAQAQLSMQQQLSSVIQRVRVGSDSVGTASAEIAQGNQDLSLRTEQQASSLEETAASMEQLSATVAQNAQQSSVANQLATEASALAAQGGSVVNDVVTTMTDISGASNKISDIISVIDGIAFQTNILALNAAVEAARAGEAGRGFAVVATEVRALAQRSAEAAKEIKTLIGASTEKVGQGTVLVHQAGESIQKVVLSIQKVAEIITEINGAAAEQRAGIAQVAQAVTHMDQVTQQNAALVEEIAAASQSLNQQAVELNEAMSIFKV